MARRGAMGPASHGQSIWSTPAQIHCLNIQFQQACFVQVVDLAEVVLHQGRRSCSK